MANFQPLFALEVMGLADTFGRKALSESLSLLTTVFGGLHSLVVHDVEIRKHDVLIA